MRTEPGTGTIALTSSSADETAALGAAVGRRLRPDDVLLLYGDLGAGKTTFVQGVAEALGAREPVTSPTFTLIHEYHGRDGLLVHVDPYRLAGPDEVEGLGFLDCLGQGAFVAVEWAERLGDLAPREALVVEIEQTGPDERSIRLTWDDPRLSLIAMDLAASG
jgi:tRNA threonylcarbamoyladenosine biosynthesis protein TsaE